MQQTNLEVQKRTETGKTRIRMLREKGEVPGVLYGKKMETISVSIPLQSLEKVLSQGAAHKIINLQIQSRDGKEEKLCIIQEIQKDTFGKRLLHIDFHHISMEEKLTSKVPLTLTGEPAGIKDGGILDHVLWEVLVKALPLNLPEKLTADVSSLAINQSLHVKDIPVPEGVEILDNPTEVIAVVHPPRVEEEVAVAAPAAEGAAVAAAPVAPAQPEVITKGKKEEEAPPPEEKPKK